MCQANSKEKNVKKGDAKRDAPWFLHVTVRFHHLGEPHIIFAALLYTYIQFNQYLADIVEVKLDSKAHKDKGDKRKAAKVKVKKTVKRQSPATL